MRTAGLVFALLLASPAQARRFVVAPPPDPPPVFDATVDPLVAVMPLLNVSIESIAKYVVAVEPNELRRIKVLHDFVAERIAYDVPGSYGEVPAYDADPDLVLKNRKGVCEGYARLLEELGAAAGLDIRTVHGKTPRGTHAWNAVFLYGRWYQIDVTWDAGFVDHERFVKRYSTQYLFFTHREDHTWLSVR
jgi:transglutaminase/protease-like cytokinesis protein 3